jgi:hypothetical protein
VVIGGEVAAEVALVELAVADTVGFGCESATG